MSKQIFRSCTRFLVAAALSCVSAAGCGSVAIQPYVSPRVQATANTQPAADLGTVQEVTGTYGEGCEGRHGAWSLGATATTPLAHAALSVVKDNSSCVLSVDGIRIGADIGTSVLYVPKSPIPLEGGYCKAPVGFGTSVSADASLFVNVSLLPDITFNSDVTIQVVFAHDAKGASESKPATPAASVGASASVEGVVSPDYVALLTNLLVRTNLLGIVTTVTGSIDINAGQQPGDSYCVVPRGLGPNPTYLEIDAAFRASVATPCTGSHQSIPWTQLNLLGIPLLQSVAERTIIIAREVNGVRAYQTLNVKIAL